MDSLPANFLTLYLRRILPIFLILVQFSFSRRLRRLLLAFIGTCGAHSIFLGCWMQRVRKLEFLLEGRSVTLVHLFVEIFALMFLYFGFGMIAAVRVTWVSTDFLVSLRHALPVRAPHFFNCWVCVSGACGAASPLDSKPGH